MVFLCANFIAVGIATITATTAASSEFGRLVLENSNRTENTAGITVLAATPKLFSYCGADLEGGDTFVKRYPNPDDCVANCLPSTGCNAGTWTKFEGGTCYFKRFTKVETPILSMKPNSIAVSFLLKDDTTPSEIPYAGGGADFPGNDFETVPAAGYGTCANICVGNQKCAAWSWSPYQGGTCWLKTKPNPQVLSPGTAAGIVGHERNAAACLAYI